MQSFDIRNKKGSANVVMALGLILLILGAATQIGALRLASVLGQEEGSLLSMVLPNPANAFFYILIGAVIMISSALPDKYQKLDLYEKAVVLKRGGKGGEETILFDEVETIVWSQRGLGDPRTLFIKMDNGRRIQVMVPPRHPMPVEVEAAWKSYCNYQNRELEKEGL